MKKITLPIKPILLLIMLCLFGMPFVFKDIWVGQEMHITLIMINVCGYFVVRCFATLHDAPTFSIWRSIKWLRLLRTN